MFKFGVLVILFIAWVWSASSPVDAISQESRSRLGDPGILEDLLVQETRKNNRKAYHHKPPSKRKQYQTHNRHSDGKSGKGGYYKTDSHKGNKGYSDSTNYSRATKDNYSDSDHKKYGGKDGGKSGGQHSGGSSYGGRRSYSDGYKGNSGGRFESPYKGKFSRYTDSGDSFLSAGY